MPDIEMLRLAGIWRASDTMFWNIARLVMHVWCMVTENNVWHMILISCTWCLISKCCVWLASDAMFWNHTSDATFQNFPPDAIFWFRNVASGGHQTQYFEITRQTQYFKTRCQKQNFKIFRQTQFFVTCIMSGIVYYSGAPAHFSQFRVRWVSSLQEEPECTNLKRPPLRDGPNSAGVQFQLNSNSTLWP